MIQLFKYNEEDLSYSPVKKRKLRMLIIGAMSMFVLVLLTGILIGASMRNKVVTADCEQRNMPMSRYDVYPEDEAAWKDSVFTDYKVRADLYLSRPICEGTPLSGGMMALCARNAYDSTGILLPVELALAQAQWESGMGREGKSPINNPFNVGENDSGTVMWFDSTFDGVQKYYYYMCNDYLRCHTLDELFVSFVNCAGKRYASGEYELHVPPQYYYNKRWLDKHMKNI